MKMIFESFIKKGGVITKKKLIDVIKDYKQRDGYETENIATLVYGPIRLMANLFQYVDPGTHILFYDVCVHTESCEGSYEQIPDKLFANVFEDDIIYDSDDIIAKLEKNMREAMDWYVEQLATSRINDKTSTAEKW